jgi:hypothetical protein
MGTPGHMQHPFDIPEVRTGNDLVSYFNKIYLIGLFLLLSQN